MAHIAIASAVIGGMGAVIEGISANEQAKSAARATERQASLDADIAKADFQAKSGASIAQAGGTGLSLDSGSFMNIFTENALNEANTISDIRFAGAVDAANQRAAGKSALIGGIVEGTSQAIGGVSKAKHQKKMLNDKNSGVSGRADRRASAISKRPTGNMNPGFNKNFTVDANTGLMSPR